ncbi:hypothetical protein FEM03_00905 [Phragmitibacter flavus]|uniref:Uncharacterized protein n=1 Tax=Phragmitibacter flavus TaxID=2576071 RepID=A0A5R8KKZ6_9BACT|nr:hypothetical protein [Phragmitibacter flavus]TLD72665.1 hypothetical protein FEM03_00905 [Phragmitibacter flavus]
MKIFWTLFLSALLMTTLPSCGLANAAINAPGTLFKGMNGAVGRATGLGSINHTPEKPMLDQEALRLHRESLQITPMPATTPAANVARAH